LKKKHRLLKQKKHQQQKLKKLLLPKPKLRLQLLRLNQKLLLLKQKALNNSFIRIKTHINGEATYRFFAICYLGLTPTPLQGERGFIA